MHRHILTDKDRKKARTKHGREVHDARERGL
jgi:hypothetical protein